MKPLPWVYTALAATFLLHWPSVDIVSAQTRPSIVISELRLRGVFAADEFIELFNPTSQPIDISGWTIAGSDGGGNTLVRAIVPANVTVNPGCFFLVTNRDNYTGNVPGDLTFTASFVDSGGAAIVNASGVITDQVGFSLGSAYKEPPVLAPIAGGNNSYERKPGGEAGHADTNDNAADFRLRSASAIPPEPANPQNSQSPCLSVIEPDLEPPVFDPKPADLAAEATGPEGAVVGYEVPTATDNVDPEVAVSCAPPSGSVFPLGSTDVMCSANDAAGNVGEAAFRVTVQDTTAPVVLVPGNISDRADSAAGRIVEYSVSASDAVTAVPATACSPASGSMFALGTTTVNCQASDDAGNSSAAAFTVTIGEAVLGRMHGGGEISAHGRRVTFMFEVRESGHYVELGRLMLLVKQQGRPGRLDAASVSDVRFSETDDRVTFTAYGTWNGQPGYRFEVAAADHGEPGIGLDALQVSVMAPTGEAVEQLSGVLIAGNIQKR